jgi:poly(3-hydroxybutyrate) depolymerase
VGESERTYLAYVPAGLMPHSPLVLVLHGVQSSFFAKPTRRRLQSDVFRSVADLKTAINRFVAETNANPKPFVWAADPRRVLAAIKRGKQALESVH